MQANLQTSKCLQWYENEGQAICVGFPCALLIHQGESTAVARGFLSDYGIRSLSKSHQEKRYVFGYQGHNYSIQYEPGESSSSMFGGNSNWRGPIWFPLNYLIIHSLRKYNQYYGNSHTYEFPAVSGIKLNLKQIANQLTKRLLKISERNDTVAFQYHDSKQPEWAEEHFKEHHLFYEFFHGDTGQGLGASH